MVFVSKPDNPVHNPVISCRVVSEFTTVSVSYASSTTTNLPVIMFGNWLWRKKNQSMPREKEKIAVKWLKQRWKKKNQPKPKAWKIKRGLLSYLSDPLSWKEIAITNLPLIQQMSLTLKASLSRCAHPLHGKPFITEAGLDWGKETKPTLPQKKPN